MASGSGGDLYAVLGVSPDASPNDVRKAFRALAKELHPDVVGDDPVRTARFKEVAAAYETLSDPDRRAQYDRARARRAARAGGRPPGGFDFGQSGPWQGRPGWDGGFGAGADKARPRGPTTRDLDLEDLFNDLGGGDFGFGAQEGRARTAPQPGRDIAVFVDVPAETAARGGLVTVAYSRLKRVDGGVTLVRAEELHELRVPPGTRSGDTLRVERLGDAGEAGGPYGDLVADVRVVGVYSDEGAGRRAPGEPRADGADPFARTRGGPEGAPPGGPGVGEHEVVVDVGVAEAILGGRVVVETPTGTVRVSMPAGTSSGARLRLRGRGLPGPGGVARDVVAVVRIVVPKVLDEESRRLIERFAELNPRVEE